MYRAILPTGDIECASYERGDVGIDCYTGAGEQIAFVPYPNLVAIVDEEVAVADDRSAM